MEIARLDMEKATLEYREKARKFVQEAISYDAVYANHVAIVCGVAYFIEINPNWSEYDDLANAVQISPAINHGDLTGKVSGI
jgi:hypothetical protein